MTKYYNPKARRTLYQPGSSLPFKLSRSKIELFLNCPLCFYLDRRLGVGQPPSYPFNLNSAVDTLLKKEFDIHRAAGTTHPLLSAYGLDLVPLRHTLMDQWRENFQGVQYLHTGTNFLVTGAVDDLWVDKSGAIYVVDYKSTSKDGKVSLEADWQIGYKRQVEVYQWLLRQNGFLVSDTAYFVYCNGRTDVKAFDAKLEFDIDLIPYQGDAAWVDAALISAKACLEGKQPRPLATCDYCNYRLAAEAALINSRHGQLFN